MARRKKKGFIARLTAPKIPELNLDPDTKKSIFIVFVFLFGVISLLALFGLAGSLGQYLYVAMSYVFGWGKPIFPLSVLAIGFFLYNGDKYEIRGSKLLGLILFVISVETLLHSFVGRNMWEVSLETGEGGGYIGLFFISTFDKIMGFWAGLVVTIGMIVVSLMLLLDTTLLAMFGQDSWFAKILYPINFLFNKIFRRHHDEEEEEEEGEEENEESEDEENEEENEEEGEENEEEGEEEEEEEEGEEDGEEESEEEEEKPKKIKKPAKREKEAEKLPDVWWKPTGVEIEHPLGLLSAKKGKPMSGDISENTEKIKHSLENFGIPVEMGDISVGPTVTQYTFKPADGVKLSRITTLSSDLALALAAHPIRIEAPIPGKSLVGVEVPNQTKAMVGLREILSDKAYTERKSNLMLALGKDVAGKAWLYDIAKMPHLLVAGATNSGKSVCLHSIVLSLLYQNNPDELKFIMVDPKRLELPVYNGIPYLLTPVITDVSKTVNALKWCLNEMDRRLDILSQKSKRNIQSYNETAKTKMPYIVFIIDELADLMMVSGKEVEAGIIRLAQLARAVGIHLILATQRPSVDVITGLIKANMPARIAFSVASGTDSRTILDSLGAEKLLGRGDMLFTTAELGKPKRIQGAYVSDLEIKKIIRNIKEQSGPFEYVEGITDKQKVGGIAGMGMGSDSGGGGDDEDELLGEAQEIIINMGKASASLLQRRLSIGYARAARLLDLLEQMGVVGPSNGAKPREILISKEQYEASIDQGVSGVSLHSREDSVAPAAFLPDDDEAEEDDGDDNEEEEEEEEEEVEDEAEDENGAEEGEEEEDEEEEDEGEESEDEDDESEEKVGKNKKEIDKNVKKLIDEKPGGFDKFFSR